MTVDHQESTRHDDPVELNFTPRRRMTRWFEPVAMIRLLLRIWATRRMDDQRDGQPDRPTTVFDFTVDGSVDGEFWFDYVADLGDAFDATMTVAWHLGRRQLRRRDIDPRLRRRPEFGLPDDIPLPPTDDIPEVLPRGRLLIMGGDQVYPSGSDATYRNQLIGPYALAWEEGDEPAETAGLLALPANHDWYGGIGPFHRAFCENTTIGGWRSGQCSSWWAARLTADWWVWGVDTALDGTINQAQLDHFRSVRAGMDATARLIVCLPVPPWRLRERYVDRLDHLARFFAELDIEPEVYLSGDYHVSALHRRDRVDGRTEWHLTSGGGGAFQHPVHNLALSIPDEHGGLPTPEVAGPEPFRKVASWPSSAESRAGSGGWWNLLFDRTAYTLVAALTAIQLTVMLITGAHRRGEQANLRSAVETLVDLLVPYGAVASIALILVAMFGLAKANSAARGAAVWARAVGCGHGMAQATVFTVAGLVGNLAVRWTTTELTADPAEGLASNLVALATLLVAAAVAGVASLVVLGSYLQLANRHFRMHDNESYSARHSGDNRHFARFRIAADGSLSCYVVAFRRTGRGWEEALTGDGPVPPTTASAPELIDVRFRTSPRSDDGDLITDPPVNANT